MSTPTPSQIEELLELFEERLNAQEELIANMMLAYTEMASTIEGVVAHIMLPYSEEEQEEFRTLLRGFHLETLKMLKETSASVGAMERTAADPTAAVFRMAEEQSATTSEQ